MLWMPSFKIEVQSFVEQSFLRLGFQHKVHQCQNCLHWVHTHGVRLRRRNGATTGHFQIFKYPIFPTEPEPNSAGGTITLFAMITQIILSHLGYRDRSSLLGKASLSHPHLAQLNPILSGRKALVFGPYDLQHFGC